MGKHSALNECADGKWAKDCLIRSYDFQAPISEYGEIRGKYRMLNMLHMFVADFGDRLAPMEYVEAEKTPTKFDKKMLRYCMRTDGKSGFVFVSHYQRLTDLENVENAEIDTGIVKFPKINVRGDVCFFMPFNMPLYDITLEYATVQPLCKMGDTYFFASIDGVDVEYKFSDGDVKNDAVFKKNNTQIVTLAPDKAMYLRKLSGKVYLGLDCDIYEDNDKILCADDRGYSYLEWNGNEFIEHTVYRDFENTIVTVNKISHTPLEINPEYRHELEIGGKRELTWYRIVVSSDKGFIELDNVCDTAQVYADGELVADEFYYGVPWRIKASLLFGKECYLVTSQMMNDFYREF